MRALRQRAPELSFWFLGNERGPVAGHGEGTFESLDLELDVRLLPGGGGRLARLVLWPRRAARAVALARAIRPAVIQASDAREIVAALVMSLASGARPIYDSHEDYFRQAFEYGRRRPIALLRGIGLRVRELLLLRFFSAVFCTDEFLHERYAARRYGIRRLHLLRNLPFVPDGPTPGHDQRADGELKLVYIGGVNEHRGIRECAEHVRRFNAAFAPSRRLSLSLYGPRHPIAVELEQAGLLTHHGWLEYPQLMATLRDYDVGVCLWLPIKKFERNLPLKNFDYMAAGLPILTSDFGNLRRYLELSGGGVAIDPTSYQQFEREVLRLFDPRLRQRLATNGRRFIQETGGFARESRPYVDVIEELCR
ncbi:MAG: glycosyltransferase [Deltaproteobacteria bacterium]|nr:glycosyltransferase [Deltaproteobacteria bacterium]MBW2531798.1 glycosyltransferase [Deltaproteobacteria bacterium]